MAKVTLSTITSGYQDANAINDNFEALATALENTVSRDGTTPNTFSADLDLNGNLILNQATNPTADSYSWEGDWATATAYELNDLVFVTVATDGTYGGATYICRIAHTSGTFSTDYVTNSYWDLVAKRGASGAGSGDLVGANSLGDIGSTGGSVATARTNLALGDAATFNEGIDAADQILTTNDIYTSTSLAISGGSITPVKALHTVTPETGVADNIDTLATTSIIDGGTVLIRCNDSGDTITIRDAVDNIYTRDSTNIELDDTEKSVTFQLRGTDWYEVSRSWEGWTLATPVATTSGTTADFTSIPSGTKVIHVNFQEVASNGTDSFLIQIGTGGSPTTTGYYSVGMSAINGALPAISNSTAGFLVRRVTDVQTYGTVILTLLNSSTNVWTATGVVAGDTNFMYWTGGHGTLSGELDNVRIRMTGSNSFDDGQINITYQ